MKRIKKAVLTVLSIVYLGLVFTVIAAVVVFTVWGYKMHRGAVAESSLTELTETIRNGDFTPISELPEFYLEAVICTEDRRFYEHDGIDIKAIARALWHDLRTLSLEQGGSTITQQLAKNLYYSQEKRFERKTAEVFTAKLIEKELTKTEILELYVNSIYFGEGCYGIAAAAREYFDKSPSELTEYECAMLAGIPQAPNAYSPLQSPRLAKQRTEQVLDGMVECGVLTNLHAEMILNT